MQKKITNILKNLVVERFLVFLRYSYWKLFIGEIGTNVRFYGKIKFIKPYNISIGDDCTFNEGVILNATTEIFIGNNVSISSGVTILTAGLLYEQYPKKHFFREVIIKNGVWIGSNATILPGVTIGSNSVIGAGAVVTKDIPSNSVAVGVPAKVIKTLER